MRAASAGAVAVVVAVAAVALGACSGDRSPRAPEPTARPSSDASSAAALGATSAIATATLGPTSSARAGTTTATSADAPLFSYEEGTTTIAFSPSGKVRITLASNGAAQSCESELGDKGNMWTRGDVTAAFGAPEVAAALAQNQIYRSSYPSPARLVAGGGTIRWVTEWKELPPDEPPAVRHLREVLHVVLTNRTSLCP